MAFLEQVAIFLAAAVVVVPLARRAGMGSVLGYMLAGLIVGPWALDLVDDEQEILHFAELGVVPAAVRHRPRTAAAASMGHAPGGVRAGRRAIRADRCSTRRSRLGVGTAARGRRGCRTRPVAVVNRLRIAGALRAQRTHDPPRPPVVLDPAVPGPRGDPHPGPSAPSGARVHKRRRGSSLARYRQGGRPDRADGARWPLPPAPRAAARGAVWHARGVHRDGLAHGRGRGPADGPGRPLDGPWRVPGRRAARRFRVPARTRSRYRALQGAASRPVLHGSRNDCQHRPGDRNAPLPCWASRSV